MSARDLGILGLFAGAAILSWILTFQVRRYAISRNVLDVPNERSAHATPVPRGGGLAVLAVVWVGLVILTLLDLVRADVGLALLCGGVLVGGVGWSDDRKGLPALARFAVHFLAAALAVAAIGGMPVVRIAQWNLHLGVVGSLLAVVVIVWLVNLYNFMDGIDGLAGGNAVTVGVLGSVLFLFSGHLPLASISALIAGASLGFLIWNWSPAKIFLGDVGSGSLGFYFGVLAIESERANAIPLLLWIVLLGAFVVDATITLLRRFLGGEAWYKAHSDHAYQRAVKAGFSHRAVTYVFVALNVALAASVFLAQRWTDSALVIALSAIALLVAVYLAVEHLKPMKSRQLR